MAELNKTYKANPNCSTCHKPFFYIGDTPEGGWVAGLEPFCTCGQKKCPECNQIIPKAK